jgi:ribonuclease D
MDFIYISSEDDLSFLNQELLQKGFVGIDTEFRRTNKYNMKLGLIQINDGEETYLIDPILIEEPKDSASFLFSSSVLKIFHSCKEDLEAIKSWTGRQTCNIFDTQLANAFLNGGFSMSYQGLVDNKIGIILDKKETRSNWIRRPLSDDQLKYAALDVEYLINLYKIQEEELSRTSKLVWHNQDIERLMRETFDPSNTFSELERTITRAEESAILAKLNSIVEMISINKQINPTLFFSKKAQKDFLRLVFIQGLDLACKELTPWRSDLIKKEMEVLLG